jgi:hypothetical protein
VKLAGKHNLDYSPIFYYLLKEIKYVHLKQGIHVNIQIKRVSSRICTVLFNVIRMIMTKRSGWRGSISRMDDITITLKLLTGEPTGKILNGDSGFVEGFCIVLYYI